MLIKNKELLGMGFGWEKWIQLVMHKDSWQQNRTGRQ